MNDPDLFDDLKQLAGLARSRAGKTGPIREGLEERIVRLHAALEAAQQEAEAWQMIRLWAGADDMANRGVSCWPARGPDEWGWLVYLIDGGYRVHGTDFEGSTLLEALTKATAWCRVELVK